ncbi:MAG: flippase-like domain-containing protein [Bacteroidales bacterium]|nr:flippase-like domain-containing protein [Bacteroidales bacterium]
MYKNKYFKLFLKLLLVTISYGYIYYKFKTNDFRWGQVSIANPLLLLIAFVLMPVNWLLESFKWRSLLSEIEYMPLGKAIRAVSIGVTSGLATPNRIGDYFGRVAILQKGSRIKGTLATMLGSWAQVLITLIMGLVSWVIIFNDLEFFEKAHYKPIFLIGIALLAIFMLLLYYRIRWIKDLAKWFNINQKYVDELRYLTRFRSSHLSYILFLSFFRYVVFVTQYILILRALGVHVPILSNIAGIGLVYLIVLAVPHFTISEVGVRGSIAILILQAYTEKLELVAIAAAIIWFINIILPAILGSYFLLSGSFSRKKISE